MYELLSESAFCTCLHDPRVLHGLERPRATSEVHERNDLGVSESGVNSS